MSDEKKKRPVLTPAQKLDRLIHWTTFRSVSNAHAVKLTIFIPVIGYWILFNEKLLPYIALSHKITNGALPGPEPLPLNLLCLYFGLCLIAAGSLLYQVFCPREIKKYGEPTEYVAGDLPHMSVLVQSDVRDVVFKKRYEDFDYIRNHYVPQLDRHKESSPEYGVLYRDYGAGILSLYYDVLNESYRAARLALLLLYGLGFGALAVPSLKVFAKVAFLLLAAF
ncbi:MAG: hypothetical protein IT558_02065 [Alphaproteobacteria bacterium]|nr:hypothetical protein [Alphaproteobacteria bacterium]